jgi:16S rRNA (cytosine1402-N4)-methyltransferase
MVQPILDGLLVAETPNAVWIDGTLGAGGHSHAILTARDDSRLLGLDLDPSAINLARQRLNDFGERAVLRHASYEAMRDLVWEVFGVDQVDGILLDLGISSMLIDQAERGFSFRLEAELDMRFDPTSLRPTAADLVNQLPEYELADLIFRYGEEPDSRRIAKAIIAARPIHSTTQLAAIIEKQSRIPRYKQKIHPATQTFQALRIAVNDELGAIERVLPIAIDLLKPGGRLAVITFHSLEDRIVKDTFKLAATECICPPQQPICTCNHHANLRLITRKPLTPDETEIQANPRARSAKLRMVEKLP